MAPSSMARAVKLTPAVPAWSVSSRPRRRPFASTAPMGTPMALTSSPVSENLMTGCSTLPPNSASPSTVPPQPPPDSPSPSRDRSEKSTERFQGDGAGKWTVPVPSATASPRCSSAVSMTAFSPSTMRAPMRPQSNPRPQSVPRPRVPWKDMFTFGMAPSKGMDTWTLPSMASWKRRAVGSQGRTTSKRSRSRPRAEAWDGRIRIGVAPRSMVASTE